MVPPTPSLGACAPPATPAPPPMAVVFVDGSVTRRRYGAAKGDLSSPSAVPFRWFSVDRRIIPLTPRCSSPYRLAVSGRIGRFVYLCCYFAPGGAAKYCDDRVCVFVCPRAHHVRSSPIVLCMLPTSVARSSSGGVAICYVFPVLWMTSYLHIIGRMQRCRCNAGFWVEKVRIPPAEGRGPPGGANASNDRYHFNIYMSINLETSRQRSSIQLTLRSDTIIARSVQ